MYGAICKNCGEKEAEHNGACGAENPDKINRGYKYSLSKCPGFEYSKRDMKEIERFSREHNETIEWALTLPPPMDEDIEMAGADYCSMNLLKKDEDPRDHFYIT